MSGVVGGRTPATLAAGLARAQAPLIAGLTLLSVLAFGVADGSFLAGALGFGYGLAVSTGIHEFGHALFYWWLGKSVDRPVLVGVRWGLALWTETPDASTTRLVALGGPVVPSLLGGAVGWSALWIGSPWLQGAALGLLVHLFGLLPGSRDGDRIWGLTESPGSRSS